MKQKGKRVLSMLLVLVMLLGMVPGVTIEADATDDTPKLVYEVSTLAELQEALSKVKADKLLGAEIIVKNGPINLPAGTELDGGVPVRVFGNLRTVTSFITIRVAQPFLRASGVDATSPTSGGVFTVTDGNVTLKNMVIMGGEGGYAVAQTGGVLTMDTVSITRSNGGLSVADGTAILKGSSVGRNKIEDAIMSYPTGSGIKAVGSATVILDRTSVSENRIMTGAGGGVELTGGAKLYANNSTFINNAAGDIGGGIDVNGGEAYLMNCTLSGNVISRTSENEGVDTSKRAGGGVGLRNGGKLYGANTLFLNNYLQHGTDFYVSDVGMWGDTANTLSLANCGYNTIVDGEQVTTLTDCKTVGTEGEAVSNHGIKTTIPVGGHIRPAAPKRNEVLLQFYAAFVEDLYVPLTKADGYETLRTDSHALTGGVDTYFDYSADGTNVRMSYGENGATSLIPGGSAATTKVTETFERYSDDPYTETPVVTPRASGVIGASNAGAFKPVPLESNRTYQVPIITILYKERDDDPSAEHLHVIDATQYGDSYMRFTEKDLRYTLDAGYELTQPATTQPMGDNTISKEVVAGAQTTAPYTPTNPLRYFSAEAMSNEYFTRPAVGEAQPVTVELCKWFRNAPANTAEVYETDTSRYMGSAYTLPDAPAIEGYEFWFWANQNGSPWLDQSGQPLAHPTVQLTSGTNRFLATYRVYVPSYNITFKWNIPGTQTEDVVKTCRANEVVPPDSTAQTRPGYRIDYWSTDPNDAGENNVRLDPSGYIYNSWYEPYQASGDTTFYAHWVEDTIRVLYVPSGSGETGSPWYNDVRRGEQYQLSENQFKREGYVLDYWQGYIDGVGLVKFSDRQTVNTSEWGSVMGVQLTPFWKQIPRPTVTALTYNGTEQTLAVTPEGETILYGSSENGPWSETPPKGKDAGEYKFWYKSGGADPVELTVTIAPKEVSVTGLKAVKVYDGTTKGATLDASGAMFTGIVEGDTLGITCDAASIKGYNYDITYVGTGKGAEFTNPTLTGADAKNYKLTSATGTGEITKRPITIKALDQTVEVGSFDAVSGLKLDNSTTYESTTDAAKGAAAENLPQGFFLKRLKLKAEGNDKKGEGKVSVSSVAVFEGEYYDASNFFEITYAPGKLTVTGAKLTRDSLTASGITYGQSLNDSTLQGVVKDKDGNEVPGTFTWKNTDPKPGVTDSNYTPYAVVFTPNDTDKYDPLDLTATVPVAPREISVEWRDTEFTYDGESHKPSATVNGLLPGDVCTVDVSGEKTDAGEGYTATAESLSNPNYKLPDAKPTTTFKIAKANVGGITPPTAKELTYNGTDQELIEPGSVSEGGRMLYSLDGENYSDTIPTGKDAGEYTVYYKVESDENHNDTEPQSITVTVKPKEVTLVWRDTQFVYDGQAHKPTVSAEGLIGSDTLDITVSGEQTNAGDDYTATASLEEAGNYKLPEDATTSFQITRRPINVVAKPQTAHIGGSVSSTAGDALLNGAVTGHAISEVTLAASDLTHASSNATVTPSAAKITDGTVDVTDNYAITYVGGNLTVLGNVVWVKQNANGSWPASAPTATESNSAARTGTGTSYTVTSDDASRYSTEHYHLAGYGTTYSADSAIPTQAGTTLNLGEGVDTLYLYYAVNTYDLVFYEDAAGTEESRVVPVRYGASLASYKDTKPADRNDYRFAGWSTTPNLNLSTLRDKQGKLVTKDKNDQTVSFALFDFTTTMSGADVKLYPIWIHDRLNIHLDLGAYDTVYHSAEYTSTHDWYAASQNGKDQKTPATMAAGQSRDFTVDIGETIRKENLIAATRVGYELEGWYTKGGLKWSADWTRGMDPAYTDSPTKQSNNARVYDYYTVTLTAHWTPKSIPVVYNLGDHAKDGAAAPENGAVALEGSTTLAAAPEAAEEYEFIGWRDKSGKLHSADETFEFNDWDLTDAPTEQITLTAVYEELAQIDVYFDTDGGTAVNPITGHNNQMLAMSNYQTKKTGYTFDGWYLDNTKVDDTYTLQAQADTTITFIAHWTINQYTITFDTMGGNEIAPIKQNYDTGIVAPTDPTRTGYTFQGWSPALPAKMPAHDLTVEAIWQLNKHTLTLNRGDETEPVAQEKDYGSAVTVEAPTREGYTFQYWKDDDGKKVSFPFAMPDNDVTLTAVWKQNQQPPTVAATAPDANTVQVTDPQGDVEYIIVPKDQTPKAEDWKSAKKIDGQGEVKWNDRLPATEYDVYARRFETEDMMPSEAVKDTVKAPKADQQAPAAPPAKAKDPTTVIVDPTDENEEYIIVPKGDPIPENPEWKSPDANGKVEWPDKTPNTEYDVYARLKGTDTQNPSEPSPKATVKTPKYPNSVTPPTADPLTYNGQAQNLLKTLPAVEQDHGTVEYSLDGENWTTEQPTGKNAGKYTVWYRVAGNDHYEDVPPASIDVTIQPKEIGLAWTGTELTYNGQPQKPTAAATGIEEGDTCDVTVIGEKINAGEGYTATAAQLSNPNYKLPTGNTTLFKIKKAPQDPPVVGKTDETIKDKNDGAITDVTDKMEYSDDDGATWKPIGGTKLENLPDGIYQVRYKADPNHEASEATEVTIDEGPAATVKFVSNGGAAVPDQTGLSYGVTVTQPEGVLRSGYHFLGWFKDSALTQAWNFEADTVQTLSTTLYAGWTTVEVHAISGEVHKYNGEPYPGVTVTLMQNGKALGSTQSKDGGAYSLNATPGEYNIVAVDNQTGLTKTYLITVEGEDQTLNIIMPNGEKNSILDNESAGKFPATVGGLDDIADKITSSELLPTDGIARKITITLTVTDDDKVGNDTLTMAQQTTYAEGKDAIRNIPEASGKTLDFLNLKLEKSTFFKNAGVQDGETVDLGDTNTTLLTIIIPYERGSKQNITVFRYHGSTATAMKENPDLSADEEGYQVYSDHIKLYSKSFSPYAIGYTLPAPSSSDSAAAPSTPPVKKPASPADTGVADWLITGDHIVYLRGYDDGTISPNNNITRAEVSMIFYRLLLKPQVEIVKTFPDVKDNEWYATAVNTLANLGIVNGYDDGLFHANNPITRAEFAAIATRFAKATGGAVNFADVVSNHWAYGNIATAADYGWVTGYEGMFRPADRITRAETATIVNHMLGRAADQEYVLANSDKIKYFPDLQDATKWYYFDMVEASNEHDFTHDKDGVEKWNK